MFLLPMVLVILGVSVIIWAVKMDYSSSPENSETLAALKGVASVKIDLKQVQAELRIAESRIADYEQRIVNNESNLMNLSSELQRTKTLIDHLDNRVSPQVIAINSLAQEVVGKPTKALKVKKHQEVIELSEQGFSVVEIASRLALSQDAVFMILKTAQRRDVI